MTIRQLYKLKLYVVLLVMMLIGGFASAAMPPAGYVIGNQASAQYLVDGQTFTVTSNLVTTSIARKYVVQLTNTQTLQTFPGKTVYFPHQVTNTGNYFDSYNLTAVAVTGNSTGLGSPIAIYDDPTGTGVPGTPITSISNLAPGAVHNIVVAVPTLASTTIYGINSQITVTATSQNAPGAGQISTATNTDTVLFTNNAIVNVSKAFNKPSVTPGAALPANTATVTLSYANTTSTTSGQVRIVDILPAGLVYVAGTSTWNGTALNDNGTGNPAGISVGSSNNTTDTNHVEFTLASVANENGTISFQVKVLDGTAPGIVNNQASVYCDCTNSGTLPTNTTSVTNNAPLTINGVVGVRVTDEGSSMDSDGQNDVVYIDQASQGQVVRFDNVVVNTGTGTDTFNMTVPALGGPNNTYPPGSSFVFLKEDGLTPLTDTNGDGTVDTGPVAAGQPTHVWLRVQLPPGVSSGIALNVAKTATSVTDNTRSAFVIDRLGRINDAVVDLANTATGTPGTSGPGGWGPGPETAPVSVHSANPNSTVTFDLYLSHSSGVAASYLLQYSTDPTFAAGNVNVMPQGWGVVFQDMGGNVITSQMMSANDAIPYHYQAVVTVPSSAVFGQQPVYFRVISTALGISDIKYDAVNVNAVHDVSISPNNIAQITPGNSNIYTHVLENLGNVTESSGSATLTINTATGWSATAYLDANNNGVFDSSDPVFTNISQIAGGAGLASRATVNIFVKVNAPASALAADNQVATINVSVAGDSNASNNSATDSTTVITGDVSLFKEQAPDPNCSLAPGAGTYVTSQITTIQPGGCILYRVTARNTSPLAVNTVSVNDEVPQYSTLNAAVTSGGTAAGATIVKQPAIGGTGNILVRWPTLNSGETGIIYFRVQLNQ